MKNPDLKNLEKLRINFFEELNAVPKELLEKKDNTKNWSINEHLFHAWLAETSTEQYIRTKTKYPDSIKEMSPLVHLRTIGLRLFLKLGLKAKAPKPTSTFPENIDLNELNKKWAESRTSFQKLIEDLEENKLENKAIFRHPLMGRINLKLTLYFFNFHFKHHQNIINNLKNK